MTLGGDAPSTERSHWASVGDQIVQFTSIWLLKHGQSLHSASETPDSIFKHPPTAHSSAAVDNRISLGQCRRHHRSLTSPQDLSRVE